MYPESSKKSDGVDSKCVYMGILLIDEGKRVGVKGFFFFLTEENALR